MTTDPISIGNGAVQTSDGTIFSGGDYSQNQLAAGAHQANLASGTRVAMMGVNATFTVALYIVLAIPLVIGVILGVLAEWLYSLGWIGKIVLTPLAWLGGAVFFTPVLASLAIVLQPLYGGDLEGTGLLYLLPQLGDSFLLELISPLFLAVAALALIFTLIVMWLLDYTDDISIRLVKCVAIMGYGYYAIGFGMPALYGVIGFVFGTSITTMVPTAILYLALSYFALRTWFKSVWTNRKAWKALSKEEKAEKRKASRREAWENQIEAATGVITWLARFFLKVFLWIFFLLYVPLVGLLSWQRLDRDKKEITAHSLATAAIETAPEVREAWEELKDLANHLAGTKKALVLADKVTLRTQPDSKSPQVKSKFPDTQGEYVTVKKGQETRLAASPRDGWAYIEPDSSIGYLDNPGYIEAKYVEIYEDKVLYKAYVRGTKPGDGIYLMPEPNAHDSQYLARMLYGTKVSVLSTDKNGWTQVRGAGKKGYVRTRDINRFDAIGRVLSVKAYTLPLYEKPDIASKVVAETKIGDRLKTVAFPKNDGWEEVGFNGRKGFVPKRYVAEIYKEGRYLQDKMD